MNPSANAPRSSDSAALTASTGLSPAPAGCRPGEHDLGIGLGLEDRPLFLERLAQLAEILDDAVVNHGDVFGRVRMRVVLGRLAVGGPAGVADAGVALERFGIQPLFEVLQLALGAAARKVTAFQRGDPCEIIAAIFKPLERIDQLLRDRSFPKMPTMPHMRFNFPKSTTVASQPANPLNENHSLTDTQ